MHAGAAETVDVVFFQPAFLERCGVRGAVFFYDLQLQLRPITDLVEPEGKIAHALNRASGRIEGEGAPGNWLHSLPSSRRPPVFGVRPPHCLKKNATSASTHWSRTSIAHSAS